MLTDTGLVSLPVPAGTEVAVDDERERRRRKRAERDWPMIVGWSAAAIIALGISPWRESWIAWGALLFVLPQLVYWHIYGDRDGR